MLIVNYFSTNTIITLQGLCFVLMLNSIIAGLYLLLARNPIHSLLALISVFLNIIILLLTLKVEFLALIFLIVYVGAIAILFLFVLMMFNLKKLQIFEFNANLWYIIFLYLIVIPKTYYLICTAIRTFMMSYNKNDLNLNDLCTITNEFTFIIKYKTNDILIFSDLFYTYYSPNFILIGIILLTAMLGSIILALSTLEDSNYLLVLEQFFIFRYINLYKLRIRV